MNEHIMNRYNKECKTGKMLSDMKRRMSKRSVIRFIRTDKFATINIYHHLLKDQLLDVNSNVDNDVYGKPDL